MSASLRPIDVFPITTRTLEVLRVGDVTPGMRRVTLGGPGLQAHIADTGYRVHAFRSDGFDDEFKLILKHPDADTLVAPTQADGVLNWPMDNPLLAARTYTVRRWDPQAGELDVDIVKHGSGLASRWAQTVHPGDQVQVAGPKSSAGQPENADWILAAGDETALPAIGRWLENWPDDTRGQIFIEVAESSHRQELPQPEGVEINWLVRDGAPAGTTTLLLDAIKTAQWWDGTVFAWVAGESLTLAPIRRWLRNEKQLAKSQLEVTGYWRKQPDTDSEDLAGLDVMGSTMAQSLKMRRLADIVPGFAIRAAVTIGLPAALESGPHTVQQLADETGASQTGIAKLLRYLTNLGIVAESSNDGFALTDFGAELTDEHLADELDLAGDHAIRELLGLATLADAVGCGVPGQAARIDITAARAMLDDPTVVTRRISDETTMAGYLAVPLTRASELRGLRSISVSGLGAATIAAALVREDDQLVVRVIADAVELDALRAQIAEHARIDFSSTESGSDIASTDAALLVNMLNGFSDDVAAAELQAISQRLNPGGRILILTEVFDAQLAYPHDYAEDLIDFGLSGGGARDQRQYEELFAAAGLQLVQRSTLGWGFTLFSVGAAS